MKGPSAPDSTTNDDDHVAALAEILRGIAPFDGLSGAVVRLGSQCGVPTPCHKFVTQALAPFVAGKPVA